MGSLRTHLHHIGWICLHEVQAEARGFASVSTMCTFGAIAVLLQALILETMGAPQTSLVSGVLWGALLFAGTAGLERLFGSPNARATMEFLLAAPVSRLSIYLGKWLYSSLLLGVAGLVSMVLVTVLFDAPLAQLWILVGLLLGCMGYAAIGITVSAMMASIPHGQGLVAVVVLPLALPLFMAGTGMGQAVLAFEPWQVIQRWLLLVMLFDLIAVTAGILVSNFLWRDWR